MVSAWNLFLIDAAMAAHLPAYAELHCLSNFTFLRGASHPEELIERAAALGYSALALTDECSFAGIVRAHKAAKGCRFKMIVGSEITTEDGLRAVLLSSDRSAYAALSMLITTGRRRGQKGLYHLTREDLETLSGRGVLILYLPGHISHIETERERARWIAERFGSDAWIAAELHCGPDDRARLLTLRELSAQVGVPLVAAGDVHMHVRSRRPLQDTLTAIRLRKPLAQCGMALHPNAERHLRLRMRLAQIYPEELLAETQEISGRCSFSLDELQYSYPDELVPDGETASSWLRVLTEEGLRRRFPAGVPDDVRVLIERELRLIAELRYEAFFLTVQDLVRFSRERGILCQGRGSAANSAVCYALGITEVDPNRMSVLFERFISKERGEPPDIDVDFEHERREEVIQYVYAKYGRERAALAATVIRYRTRSALRDAGKALGLPSERIDGLAKMLSGWNEHRSVPECLREVGVDPQDGTTAHLINIAQTLAGFPRHLSQHVGGFVISGRPLSELVPVENAAMCGRTVIQWDKDDLDTLGLLKVDVLALGMLSAIRRALGLVGQRRGISFHIQDIPSEDPQVYAMLQRADAIGVFQVESRAQMSMLPRLKPEKFYDLVIEVAIVRPGPIQGGMVHPYLRRRQKLEPVSYPNKAVQQVLERTLGVPIFQEQVMQLAMLGAGFTAGEADDLRRSMAAWRRQGDLAHFQERLIRGMQARGISSEFAERLYRQILGFGEYGFPESHAASFALLVYVSAWLKCHEPESFCAALLNSQPMGFYASAQLVQDAQRHGVEVRPVDVCASDWDCTLEEVAKSRPAVRLGLRLVRGLHERTARRMVVARAERPYRDVNDLAYRASLNRGELRNLSAAGALATLAGHRYQARWLVEGVQARQNGIFDAVPIEESSVALSVPTEAQDILADYANLGLSLRRHPLALLRRHLSGRGVLCADDLRSLPDGRAAYCAGLVTCRQRPDTASGVVFVTIEDETGYVNVVVWRDLAARQRPILVGARLLGVQGTIERDGDVVHLLAHRLFDNSRFLGDLVVRARDFH